MKITDTMVLFWNGIFSQWEPCNFIVNGVEYNCAEQYMMSEKAKFFHDKDAEQEIMDTDDPKIQKQIGRTVQNFDEDEWNKVAMDIVIKGNLAKFSQNPELKKQLLKTGDKLLVEASPYDAIWGIGLRENDPRALDRSQWLGTNWLGEALAEVRSILAQKGNV